jgi:hypothetical protein
LYNRDGYNRPLPDFNQQIIEDVPAPELLPVTVGLPSVTSSQADLMPKRAHFEATDNLNQAESDEDIAATAPAPAPALATNREIEIRIAEPKLVKHQSARRKNNNVGPEVERAATDGEAVTQERVMRNKQRHRHHHHHHRRHRHHNHRDRDDDDDDDDDDNGPRAADTDDVDGERGRKKHHKKHCHRHRSHGDVSGDDTPTETNVDGCEEHDDDTSRHKHRHHRHHHRHHRHRHHHHRHRSADDDIDGSETNGEESGKDDSSKAASRSLSRSSRRRRRNNAGDGNDCEQKIDDGRWRENDENGTGKRMFERQSADAAAGSGQMLGVGQLFSRRSTQVKIATTSSTTDGNEAVIENIE